MTLVLFLKVELSTTTHKLDFLSECLSSPLSFRFFKKCHRFISFLSGNFRKKMLNHHLRSSLLILLATASLQIPAASDLSSLEEKTSIPFGYFDTSTSGAEKAAKDIAAGQPRFALMGMPSTVFVKKLESVGIQPIFFGCVIEEKGLQFWEGYNMLIEKTFAL